MTLTVGCVPGEPFLEHVEPAGHPERRDRLHAVAEAMEEVDGWTPLPHVRATDEQLSAVHSASLLAQLPAAARGEVLIPDADVYLSPSSFEVAALAAGSCCAAVDALVQREIDVAWSFVRPPGHHCTADTPMGFCLLNNVAVAARHAQNAHGIKNVLVIDWDVHHGNGTEAIFWEDPALHFFSSHQSPLYPGTGREQDRGAHGNVVNVPLAAGSGDDALLSALEHGCGPLLDRAQPDLIIVSAGFDAHYRDPLGGLSVTEAGFAAATRWVLSRAGGRPVLFSLEGGYDLVGLRDSVKSSLLACISG
ncbi:MAG: histone deacetylase [Myxococcota bacterium]